MSDDDNSISSSDARQSLDFNPWFVGKVERMTYLKNLKDLQHVPGDELNHLLPKDFDTLVFEGHASREYKEYERILYLLQSDRHLSTIGLSDRGSGRATPEFLSLVVLALTKTNHVTLSDCPMDENFFACLNSGIQTLTKVEMLNSSIRISYNAAAIFANGLALSGCLESLVIDKECVFEPGAGLKLVQGIKRNKSLKRLRLSEFNLSSVARSVPRSVAMISILGGISDGCLPKLVYLTIELKYQSDCTDVLTKLMTSDTCHVVTLSIDARYRSSTMFRTDSVQMGKPNLKLKSLHLTNAIFDESYLSKMLPMMPTLSSLCLGCCGISEVTPIIDHLLRPNTAIKWINLHSNLIGIDQAEKFVGSLANMQSLTDVNISNNPWCKEDDSVGQERVRNILQQVSNCWNLENFTFRRSFAGEMKKWAKEFDQSLNLTIAINRAWRRELCYKNSSPASKLLPLVIARALRKTKDDDLHADVVFPLLRERVRDLKPAVTNK